MYDITLIYQRTVCFLTAVFRSAFRLKLQSVAMLASSRKCLLEDEIEQSLIEELTVSYQSSLFILFIYFIVHSYDPYKNWILNLSSR